MKNILHSTKLLNLYRTYCTRNRVPRRIISFVLTLILCFSLSLEGWSNFFSPLVAQAADTVYVSSFLELKDQIQSYATAGDDMVITVTEDITMTANLTIPENLNGKTLTITSDIPIKTITRDVKYDMFTVNSGATLIFKNIIIDGNKTSYGGFGFDFNSFVHAFGTFVMESGAILQNNLCYRYGNVDDGDVHVRNGGIFIMNGGSIINNGDYWDDHTGAVGIEGTFIMNNGIISDNEHGVALIGSGGIFIMNGGSINDNSRAGVYAPDMLSSSNTSFTMNSGTISNNQTGVFFKRHNSIFTMNGGIISDNSYAGVSFYSYNHQVTFTMNAGAISGSQVGVDVGVFPNNNTNNNIVVNMNGGTITANTTGISMSNGILRLGGNSKIYGNISDTVGNNVNLGGTSRITLGTGDTITDGSANGNGALAPTSDMEVWVSKTTDNRVIVDSGANASHLANFYSDDPTYSAILDGDAIRLAIMHKVTYNGNKSTGGALPVSGTLSFEHDSTVEVLDNIGSLVKTGYIFDGWNTAPDGSGTNYAAGTSFNISEHTTLYAKWIPIVAGSDTSVWAKIIELDADTKVYSIDIEWGNMKFVFGSDSGSWDPVTHSYTTAVDPGSWWINDKSGATTEQYLDGMNNRIVVTNRSNDSIDAGFGFEFDGGNDNLFNKAATTDDRVTGSFFATNDDALAATCLLTDADIADGNVGSGNQPLAGLLLPNSEVGIASADADTGDPSDNSAQCEEVFFAFSGTPDDDSALIGGAFQRFGIITVTIMPGMP